jgi:hypothetical protein
MDGKFSGGQVEKIFTLASEVKAGDTLHFGDPKYDIKVERVTAPGFDGVTVLHANGGSWSSWYESGNSVCIHKRGEA